MEILEEKQVKMVAYKLKGAASAWWDSIQFTRKRHEVSNQILELVNETTHV